MVGIVSLTSGLGAAGVCAGDQFLSPEPAATWIVSVGTQIQAGPKFPGTDKFEIGALPLLRFRRADEPEVFVSPDDNVSYTLFGSERFRFGPAIGFDAGRYLSDDRHLIGLHKVSWGVEAGAFAEFWPILNRLRTRAEVRYGFGYRGFVADVGADWVQQLGRVTLSAGPRFELADSSYMRSYFGVTIPEARVNGVATPFRPSAGLRSVGLEAAMGYQWTEAWKSTLFIQYDRLVSDAEKSPIVANFGSRNQFTVGINFTYAFRVGL